MWNGLCRRLCRLGEVDKGVGQRGAVGIGVVQGQVTPRHEVIESQEQGREVQAHVGTTQNSHIPGGGVCHLHLPRRPYVNRGWHCGLADVGRQPMGGCRGLLALVRRRCSLR